MGCPLIGRSKFIRLTQIDDCGDPEGFAVIDNCWPSFAVSPQIEEGNDINFLDARGTSCATMPACPSYLGDQITWTFHHASPELFSVLTGATIRTNAADEPVGWDNCDIQCRAGFAAEVWLDVAGEECGENEAEGNWFYMAWPWLTSARLGDFTIENDSVSFEIVARSRQGSRWGTGPWDVQRDVLGEPGPLLDPYDSSCKGSINLLTTVPPPEGPLCELIPVGESP